MGTNSNGNRHLKGGSIAGIAIGGFVFLVLLVALVVATLHHRKRERAPTDIVMRRFVDKVEQDKRDLGQTGGDITDNHDEKEEGKKGKGEQNEENTTDNHKQKGKEIDKEELVK